MLIAVDISIYLVSDALNEGFQRFEQIPLERQISSNTSVVVLQCVHVIQSVSQSVVLTCLSDNIVGREQSGVAAEP